MNLRAFLQLFRAQTAPATLLCILVPYLHNASFFDLRTLILALSAVSFHYFSFGHNSLMDTSMGYDRRDPSKQHHPLICGVIKLHVAHNVIHWGLAILTAWATLLTLWISPNPAMALTFLILWVAFGHGYNDGLSKESLFGFMSISICCTASSTWGWFLSHEGLGELGFTYLTYVFFTILFQISWSGHLKELELKERSNILVKMGAKIEKGKFNPKWSGIYGTSVKMANLTLGLLLAVITADKLKLLWWAGMTLLATYFLKKLVMPRKYERPKELLHMSLEEVMTIYLPIPLVLPWFEAIILMAIGVVYFFGMNLWLWRVPHPAV